MYKSNAPNERIYPLNHGSNQDSAPGFKVLCRLTTPSYISILVTLMNFIFLFEVKYVIFHWLAMKLMQLLRKRSKGSSELNTQSVHRKLWFQFFLFDSHGTVRQLLILCSLWWLPGSVCITLVYCTLIYYDVRFNTKAILVNMLWICRKMSSLMPWYHVAALLINCQLSAGIYMLMGFKPNIHYKCIFISFLNVVKS